MRHSRNHYSVCTLYIYCTRELLVTCEYSVKREVCKQIVCSLSVYSCSVYSSVLSCTVARERTLPKRAKLKYTQ